jgi:hypothetical protein
VFINRDNTGELKGQGRRSSSEASSSATGSPGGKNLVVPARGFVPSTQPKRIGEVNRVAVRKAVEVEAPGQPNRIFLGEAPLPSLPWGR